MLKEAQGKDKLFRAHAGRYMTCFLGSQETDIVATLTLWNIDKTREAKMAFKMHPSPFIILHSS